MTRRDLRRLAMQALYQLDLRGEKDRAAVDETVTDHITSEGLGSEDDAGQVIALTAGAWDTRREADKLAAELAPDWPTHRQPAVDRAILRLAFHEIVSGHAPLKVAINEAVELAKEFCSENSPAFINGVLDKIARKLEAAGKVPAPAPAPAPDSKPSKSPDPDAWLKDALGD